MGAPPDSPQGDWRPKTKTDWRWAEDGAKRILTVIFILLLLGIGWRIVKGESLPPFLEKGIATAKKIVGGEAVNSSSGADGVDCFTGDDGEFIRYTDDKGTENIVESPAQVPAKYKAQARCIYLKGK